jgi:hypothetical protein
VGSRPIYCASSDGCTAFADKLSNLAVNCRAAREIDWASVLEFAGLGAVYSQNTSLRGASLLAAGESVEARNGTITKRTKHLLPDGGLDRGKVEREPVAALREVFDAAINETWTDPDVHLLLSGGLDSRVVLAMARGQRKTITLNLYNDETRLAKQVAEVCRTEHRELPIPEDHYHSVMEKAYLMTGAMQDSRCATHLGMGQVWRKQGIQGITHGYLHNTLFRSWMASPLEKYPATNSRFYQWLGRKGYYFERYACIAKSVPDDIWRVLSPQGQELLLNRMKQLEAEIQVTIEDGIDLTFERKMLGHISRQVYYPVALSWFEEIDVQSPVFHPSVWVWNALSLPRHRYKEWVFREMILQLKSPAFELPDANTGATVCHVESPWQDQIRNQFWYPWLRGAWQMFSPPPPASAPILWRRYLRGEATLRMLAELLEQLADLPYFDGAQVRVAHERYLSGNEYLVGPMWALAAASQWHGFIANSASPSSRFVRAVGQAA